MAYELLNVAQVTPSRLHALIKLISRLQAPTRKEILELLQPPMLVADQSAAKNVYNAAINCGIIQDSSENILLLNEEAAHLESMQDFQQFMQRRVLGITEQYLPNYLFNLYSAWYIVQNERVLQFVEKDYEIRFNDELFQDVETRIFNMTKFNGWRTWATFLGLGWSLKAGLTGREILVPCVSNRLRSVLTRLLPTDGQIITCSQFVEMLGKHCPELDGGKLFVYCWEASRSGEQQGHNLSFALSTGLRQLHDSREIELIRQADATDTWQLFAADGLPQHLKQVTHIRLRER